jgi:hypothetical protein
VSLVVSAPRPWLRAAVAGVVAVGVALAAHTSVDGGIPSATVLVVTVVGAALLARLMTTCEVRLPVLLAGLTLAQLGLHATFLYLSTGSATHPGVAGWLCCGDARPVASGRVEVVGVGLSRHALVLLAAHVAAVALTAWWLRRLEVRAWRIARTTATAVHDAIASLLVRVVALVPVIVPAVRRVARLTWPALRLPSSVQLTTRVSRRGPPVSVAS